MDQVIRGATLATTVSAFQKTDAEPTLEKEAYIAEQETSNTAPTKPYIVGQWGGDDDAEYGPEHYKAKTAHDAGRRSVKFEDEDVLVVRDEPDENFVLLEKLPLLIITGNSEEMTRLVINVLERHDMNYWSFVPGQLTILG